MSKILLIDDDSDHNKMVRSFLAKQHYVIEVAETGQDAMAKLTVSDFDVIILDWNLPDLTGIEVLKWYRKRGHAPVIMLTGEGQIARREEGLDAGADDYLIKPFSVRELMARVRALLRRPPAVVPEHLDIGPYRLKPESLTAVTEKEEIRLQPREFALLEFLSRNPKEIFAADVLLARVWPSESESTVDSLRTTIKKLRQKLDSGIIETIAGAGYRLGHY